ncbi:hypothetical protein [Nocardia wallacei]|uniref:hypothetical protein n=1 Tax=Nocardia wallacei TaxID=480035 RepID=UPI0024537834|nr:hypothetical protein [Nocardia wallacei]
MNISAQQLLSELPTPIQALVFGQEIPQMDTEAGRRISAAWQRAGADLARISQRIEAEIAALPDAAREDLGERIAANAQSLGKATSGSGEFCRSLGRHTDSSTADTDKELYTMYTFGLMTVYQLLVAGGWHPIRAIQVLSTARAKHLARFAAFVSERAGAGAAAAVERAGLLATQVGGMALLTAGVDAGIQAGQIVGVLDGQRETMDLRSVATAGVAGAGAGLGGAIGGRLVQAALPDGVPLLLGRAMVAGAAGVSGVVGGAAAAAAMTGEFHLSLSALFSGAAVGMASAHAYSRAHLEGPVHPDMAETGRLQDVSAPDQVARLGHTAEQRALARLRELAREPGSPVEILDPGQHVGTRSGAGDTGPRTDRHAGAAGHDAVHPAGSARQVGHDGGIAGTMPANHGEASPTPTGGGPETVADNKVSAAPAADGGMGFADRSGSGDPAQAALYRRLDELREQELAETRASGSAATSSDPARAGHPDTTPPPGETPSVSDVAAHHADAGDLDRCVRVRDEARAELAQALEVSPQEVRWWGREALEQAVGEVDTWLKSLGEKDWARMDSAAREGVLSDLGPRVAERARAIAEENRAAGPVRQWLGQAAPGGTRGEHGGQQWSAIARIAVADGASAVGRLLDGVRRYGAADAQVGAVDRRAADGVSDPGHARYSAVAPDAGVPVTGVAVVDNATKAAQAEPTHRESDRPSAVARPDSASSQYATETDRATTQSTSPAEPGSADAALAEQVRALGADVGASAVAKVRAREFEVLERNSSRARADLAEWLGISDTECYRMKPSQLRAALEEWVGWAEQMPGHWQDSARPHLGAMVGGELRRAMAAEDGLSPDVLPASEAVPAALQNRLTDLAGADAASIVQRWTQAQAAIEQFVVNPRLVLRLDPKFAMPWSFIRQRCAVLCSGYPIAGQGASAGASNCVSGRAAIRRRRPSYWGNPREP